MTRRVVINQSNYLPWKGYFDLVHDADVFVLLDDVQYTKNDWRNRNRIKTDRGLEWLTIPVGPRHRSLINQVLLPEDPSWKESHWARIVSAYQQAPHFKRYCNFLEASIRHCPFQRLSQLNHHLIQKFCEILEIRTPILFSEDFALTAAKQDRVLQLLKHVGATTYISGPAAKAYVDPEYFRSNGIQIIWKDYSGYPEYSQPYPPFEHTVSIVDLLFHCGPESPRFIWEWRSSR